MKTVPILKHNPRSEMRLVFGEDEDLDSNEISGLLPVQGGYAIVSTKSPLETDPYASTRHIRA